jgi:hypothetical protein
MLQSWLRPRQAPQKRAASYRPVLETLEDRLVLTSPHFISATAAIQDDGSLAVSWKEAGLGNNVLIDYQAAATAAGQYQWFNHGGNKPQGNPFQFGPLVVTAAGTFSSGQNGNITATLVIQPPPPNQEVLDAGSGKNWTLVLTVSYSGISITDLTNGITETAQPPSVGPVTVVVPT